MNDTHTHRTKQQIRNSEIHNDATTRRTAIRKYIETEIMNKHANKQTERQRKRQRQTERLRQRAREKRQNALMDNKGTNTDADMQAQAQFHRHVATQRRMDERTGRG